VDCEGTLMFFFFSSAAIRVGWPFLVRLHIVPSSLRLQFSDFLPGSRNSTFFWETLAMSSQALGHERLVPFRRQRVELSASSLFFSFSFVKFSYLVHH